MTVLKAVMLSLIAGLATGLGGVLLALFRELNMRTYDGLLDFMLMVTLTQPIG